jgi:hypothetical protein
MTSDRWIKLHTVESIFEMETLAASLDREDIEYVAKEHKDTAYDGLFVLQKGYATFFVRAKDEPAAREIVASVKNLPHVVPSED